MDEKISIGVIGVGHLGSHHARILSQSSRWHLTAAYDIDTERNRDATSRFQLAPCESDEELITRCECVVICTPTASHAPLAMAAIRAKRHVFVEKPLCRDEEELAQLLGEAKRQQIVVAVGHIERFNPAVGAVRSHIQEPRFIEAHRLNPFSPRGLATDVVAEIMIHDIDLVLHLVSEDPSEIRAAGVAVLSETDDIANCRLAFPSGCVANLTASRISTTPMRKLRVFSVNRYTSIDLQAKTAETYRLFSPREERPDLAYTPVFTWEGRTIARHTSDVEDVNALESELNDFHDAVLGLHPPRVGIAEAAKALRVAFAVTRACRANARTAAETLTR